MMPNDVISNDTELCKHWFVEVNSKRSLVPVSQVLVAPQRHAVRVLLFTVSSLLVDRVLS